MAATAAGKPPSKPVGWRVTVSWESGNVYEGVVTAMEEGKARIHYDDGDRDLEPVDSPRIKWLRKESVESLRLAKQVRRAWRGADDGDGAVSATAQLVNMLMAAGAKPLTDVTASQGSSTAVGPWVEPGEAQAVLGEMDLSATGASKEGEPFDALDGTHATSFSDTHLTSMDMADSEEEEDTDSDEEEESDEEDTESEEEDTESEEESDSDSDDEDGSGDDDEEEEEETSVHNMILGMRRPARGGKPVLVKWVWCEGGQPESRSGTTDKTLPVKKATLCEVDGFDVLCRLATDAFGDRAAAVTGSAAAAVAAGSPTAPVQLAYFDEDGDLICVDSNEDVQMMYGFYFRHASAAKAGKAYLRVMVSDIAFGSSTPTPDPLADSRGEVQHHGAGKLSAGSISQWRLGKLLGTGSFGKVYAGLDEGTGRNIAIKTIRLPDSMVAEFVAKAGASTTSSKMAPSPVAAADSSLDLDDTPVASPDGGGVDSLVREIHLMEGLSHPNIVQYLGSTMLIEQQKLLIFLEFAAGGSLMGVLQQFGFKQGGGGLPATLVARYTRDMTAGLQYLHSHQVVHRDMKPANVLLHEGTAKLADFGCSKIATETAVQTSTAVGTALYCAPELLSDSPTYGCASDIWSLGVTVAQLLHGSLPWGGNIAHAVYKACFSEDLPELPADVSPDAVDFIKQCLMRKAADRPDARSLLKHPFVQVDST